MSDVNMSTTDPAMTTDGHEPEAPSPNRQENLRTKVQRRLGGRYVQQLEIENSTVRDTLAFQAEIFERLMTEREQLTAERERMHDIVTHALPIIFGMQPAIQRLTGETLELKGLANGTNAVRFENVVFTLVVEPFAQRMTVSMVPQLVDGDDAPRVLVPPRTFQLPNGNIGEDVIDGFLGRVRRYVRAIDTGVDPGSDVISLEESAVESVV